MASGGVTHVTALGYCAAHACNAASANICVESPAPEIRVGRGSDGALGVGPTEPELDDVSADVGTPVVERVDGLPARTALGAAAATGAVGRNVIRIDGCGRATTPMATRLTIAIAAIAGLAAMVRRIGNSTR